MGDQYPDTYYCIGTVAGPHPYPMMVRDFQCVIGEEARKQMQEAEGRLPDMLVACVGGGSNAMGLFYPFLKDDSVKILVSKPRAMGFTQCTPQRRRWPAGRAPRQRTFLLQNDDGQIQETHSISAGLDYPGMGPEHAYLREVGRVTIFGDRRRSARRLHAPVAAEGILPALESAHAIAKVKGSRQAEERYLIVVNLSGRGDKDIGRSRKS